jgi:hypothetical protein
MFWVFRPNLVSFLHGKVGTSLSAAECSISKRSSKSFYNLFTPRYSWNTAKVGVLCKWFDWFVFINTNQSTKRSSRWLYNSIISRSMRSMNVKDYMKWLSMNNSLLRDVFGYPMQCKHLPFCPLYDVANLISTICQFQCRLFYIHVCKRSNHEYGHPQ